MVNHITDTVLPQIAECIQIGLTASVLSASVQSAVSLNSISVPENSNDEIARASFCFKATELSPKSCKTV